MLLLPKKRSEVEGMGFSIPIEDALNYANSLEKGETIKSTEKQCGMANATIQKWQKQSPRLENIEKVAKFLNVSLDWLVFGEDNKSIDEIELINNYRKLEQRDKKEIQTFFEEHLSRMCD